MGAGASPTASQCSGTIIRRGFVGAPPFFLRDLASWRIGYNARFSWRGCFLQGGSSLSLPSLPCSLGFVQAPAVCTAFDIRIGRLGRIIFPAADFAGFIFPDGVQSSGAADRARLK